MPMTMQCPKCRIMVDVPDGAMGLVQCPACTSPLPVAAPAPMRPPVQPQTVRHVHHYENERPRGGGRWVKIGATIAIAIAMFILAIAASDTKLSINAFATGGLLFMGGLIAFVVGRFMD